MEDTLETTPMDEPGMALRSLGLSFLTCKLKVTALIVLEPVKRFWMSLIGAANKKTIIVL